MGKSLFLWPFSIAMLNYQRVIHFQMWHPQLTKWSWAAKKPPPQIWRHSTSSWGNRLGKKCNRPLGLINNSSYIWWFLQMEDLQFSSNDLDDLGVPPWLRKPKKRGSKPGIKIYDVTFVLVLKVHESSPKVVYMEAPMVKAWKNDSNKLWCNFGVLLASWDCMLNLDI